MRRLLPVIALLTAAAACGTAAPASSHPAARSRPVAAAQLHTAVISGKAGPALGIRHVFVVVLENESYASTYVNNPNPYLGKTLQRQGTLLTQYYGTGHHSLDNYLSIISGQAPNPTTSADCANYDAIAGRKPLNSHGQETVAGGCIYPSNVKTLANQLTKKHISWHGWMDDMGAAPGREQATCGVPNKIAGVDETQVALPTDQYAARHNPFVYFKSLLNTGLCAKHVGPLAGLPSALKKVSTTPAFNFITPNLCNDGHDAHCAGPDAKGASNSGFAAIDDFLSVWIPRIEASPAFKKDGLIVITSDESDTGDAAACCGEKAGPTESKPGLSGPGGGRIGTLLIGRCIAAGHKDADKYNHYSFLKTLENLYGIKHGGTDGHGHLGYAAVRSLRPFGADVFSRCRSKL